MTDCIDRYAAVGAEDKEAATEKYSSYQTFLGNIMLVSTLILGFILTGTMLGISLTGTENFSAERILRFLIWVSLAGFLALFSLLSAFLIQARGTDAYTRRGAYHALRMMKRSTCAIMVTEGLLYAALLCFGFSLEMFILMNYLGPPICPRGSQADPSEHPHSRCALLGIEIYDFANTTCSGGARSRMCVLKQEYARSEPYWFGWVFRDDDVAEFQAVADEASDGLCGVSRARSAAEAACEQGGAGAALAYQQLCASASAASLLAQRCADDKMLDMERCRQVCTWFRDGRTASKIRWYMDNMVLAVSAVIGVFGSFRVFNSCCMAVAFFRSDVRKYGGVWNSFRVQLGDESLDKKKTDDTDDVT